VALISIAGQPREAGRDAPFAVAGKTLAQRQLDFVLAAGSERVIALGDGASAEAIALRHAAEGAGARFDVHPRTATACSARVGASDELLVARAGVLARVPRRSGNARKGQQGAGAACGAGVAAGFERIDLERAWAGRC
jgi:hypothetical protein